jgi:transcriptional regulator of nitric oxide reductase
MSTGTNGLRPFRRLQRAGWLGALLAVLTVVLLPAGIIGLRAQGDDHDLAKRLGPEVIQEIYPGAEEIGPTGGNPTAAEVRIGGEVVGYIFSTLDVVAAVGYTTTPFDVAGGVTLDGSVTGMKVVYHKETIFGRGVKEESLYDYLTSLAGYLAFGRNRLMPKPDTVSGGTITARAMRNAVAESARLVLRDRMDMVVVTDPAGDITGFSPWSWDELLVGQSVARRTITNGEVARELDKSGLKPVEPLGPPDEVFSDIFASIVSPRGIGQNVFGSRYYPAYMKNVPPRGHALFIGTDGPYSFRGLNYHKKAKGYLLDRVRMVQDGQVIDFSKPDHHRVGRLVDDAKAMIRTASILIVEDDRGLDLLRPWSLELRVEGEGPEGTQMVAFSIPYELPARHILLPPPKPLPAWLEPWRDGAVDVAILAAILIALTLTVVFQDTLARRRRLHRGVRYAFLGVVLGWLGLMVGGQLTIVNIINYVRAPFDNLPLEFYLRDPLLVMIVVYTLGSVVILGRGLFCGWLCPFGSMQELLFRVGRLIRLPVVQVGEQTDRLLRPTKYVALFILLGIALHSGDDARLVAEVEPFKTAVISKFDRSLPYVAYALLVLGAGLFVERAFCRYLCPLGAVLSVLGRFRLSDQLKRRIECGTCNLCAKACPVNAIDVSGKINMSECFRCLDCQVEYHDAHRCPPLAKERKRRERDEIFPQLEPATI